jgi:hypothetical protein
LTSDPDEVIARLLGYCREHDWAGYDPYDALNSRIFGALSFLDCRIPRLVLTQALKRSPIDVRRLLLVPPAQNPKGLALFLSALLCLSGSGFVYLERDIRRIIDLLLAMRSEGVPYWCWGYSFPWQTRTLLVPSGTPNLVCTCFAAEALLNAYESGYEAACLDMAVSAGEYLVKELYWNDGGSSGFSYPLPSQRTRVHNANFLGGALLCRIYRHTGEPRFKSVGLETVRYSAGKQRPDGSWPYGELPPQSWIDNFHTGYNLCALRSIRQSVGTEEFDASLRAGFEFYRSHFFRQDGAPRYFHDTTFPLDIHCVAQSIITLLRLRDLRRDNVPLAHSVFDWAMRHMWDERGFFYYRKLRFCKIRTSYMRWSQAWMALALATLCCEFGAD